MKFCFIVNSSPQEQGSTTAYELASCILNTNHDNLNEKFVNIFFSQKGIFNADLTQELSKKWQHLFLNNKNCLNLMLCMQELEKSKISSIGDEFKLSRLSELTEVILNSDKTLSF